MDPKFYITAEQYRMLVPTGSWVINDIPLNLAQGVRDHFGIQSSLALFTSGIQQPLIRPEDQVLAGLDWIRHETKPKPNEPELNVYHFAIGSGSNGTYPVFYCGASGSIAPHWSTLPDLNVYFQTGSIRNG